MKTTRISMPPGGRMLRFGVGQHKGRWFARLDLWWAGWRLTR